MDGHGRPRAATPPARVGGAVPILRVRSVQASIDHYVAALGFHVDWHDPGIMASVSRGGASLMLCEGDQGHAGTWVWLGVDDAAALHEEYVMAGATIRHAPTNYPWAYEMQVEDPDGHVLRFGSEPLREQPFGEWLDSRGVRWLPSPTGGWTRADDR